MESKVESPLRWPEGWTRTNIRDRKRNAAWKKTLTEATDSFLIELGRMAIGDIGIGEVVISYNSEPNESRRDPGVAVYFSKFRKPDYSWMDSLGLDGVPTIEQIETEFKRKAMTCHPDRFPNDPAKAELFRKRWFETGRERPRNGECQAARGDQSVAVWNQESPASTVRRSAPAV